MASYNLNVINGLSETPLLTVKNTDVRTTASLKIQEVLYKISKAIFDFTGENSGISDAINFWKSKETANLAGSVPDVFPIDIRSGAASSLLGYLSNSEKHELVSLILNAGSLKAMEPILTAYLSEFKQYKLAFQVSNAGFDFEHDQLCDASNLTLDVARHLDVPLLSSSLGLENDAYHTAYLTSVIANSLGLAFHTYDGIRGTKQASKNFGSPDLGSGELPKADNLLDAFAVANKALGTNMAPFEYYGAKEPVVVYVALGNPGVLARANPEFVGVVNVRMYYPFIGEEFLKILPASAANIVVVSEHEDLFKDVSAVIKLHYGFKYGPSLEREIIEYSDDAQPHTGAENEKTIRVWDSDKAHTAAAAGILAKFVPEANAYTRFNNMIAGGIVATDLRFNFNQQFWDLLNADAAVVNHLDILSHVNVTSTVKQGGKLVVAAASDEELAKAIPAQVKLHVAAKQLEVYRVDYSKIGTKTTEGRTMVMAAQAVFWLLSGYDVDTTTSRVVHANGNDTELVGITVNEIVRTLAEGALAKVNQEIIEKEWMQIIVPEKERSTVITTKVNSTSFLPADFSNLSAGEDEEAAPGTNIDDVSSLELKKKLIFNEAYGERLDLRPEVPSKTFVAKVKQNTRVTPSDYDRHIFELELDISGTGLKYKIGESLGVHAPNNSEQVIDFLNYYGIDPEEILGIPLSTPASEDGSKSYRTAFQVFKNYLDLFGKVPKRFYESLSHFATDEAQKTKLQQLSTAEGAEELKKRTEEDFENYVDVLKEFSSARPTLLELVDLIAPLKRREYSIASSQNVHPNEVHLLIVVVDWVTAKGVKRYGQCSKYLSELNDGAEVIVSVKPSVTQLPKDTETPIIMAGLGTGLAPFKAFLEEKMWQRDHGHKVGPVYLFLGSRHRRQEYLYGDLFEAYKAAGILTHIGAAFSRDQPEKVYIQHRIQQAKEQLVDAFVHKKGNFYLCGPTWPVPDISEALTEIVLAGAAATGEQVNVATLIEDLKEQERYILEVY